MNIFSNGSDRGELLTSTKVKRASLAIFILAAAASTTSTVFAEDAKVVLDATVATSPAAQATVVKTAITQRDLTNRHATQSIDRAGRMATNKSESSEASRIREGHRKLHPTAPDASEQPATF